LGTLGLSEGEATHALDGPPLLRRIGDEELGFVHQ